MVGSDYNGRFLAEDCRFHPSLHPEGVGFQQGRHRIPKDASRSQEVSSRSQREGEFTTADFYRRTADFTPHCAFPEAEPKRTKAHISYYKKKRVISPAVPTQIPRTQASDYNWKPESTIHGGGCSMSPVQCVERRECGWFGW